VIHLWFSIIQYIGSSGSLKVYMTMQIKVEPIIKNKFLNNTLWYSVAFNYSTGSEFLKAVISEHGRFFIMFLKRDKSSN